MMDVHIRIAGAEDAPVIALLARTSFREAFAHVWNPDTLREYLAHTFAVSKLRSSLAKENNVFWLAFADELPVGYAKLKKHSPFENLEDPAPAQLQKIYVLKDFTGCEIGAKLQEALFQEISNNGTQTLWLAVWDGNTEAIRFYEKHGFVKTTKSHYSFENMHFDYEIMTKSFASLPATLPSPSHNPSAPPPQT